MLKHSTPDRQEVFFNLLLQGGCLNTRLMLKIKDEYLRGVISGGVFLFATFSLIIEYNSLSKKNKKIKKSNWFSTKA